MYLTFLIIQQSLGILRVIRIDAKVCSENRSKYSCVEGFTDILINTIEVKKKQEI